MESIFQWIDSTRKNRGFDPTHAGFTTEYYNIGDNHKPRLENFLCIE